MDLRHVVGHANFLDHLKHLTLQAHLEVISEAPAPKRTETVRTSAIEVTEEDDLDVSDDEAMAFQSISYSKPTSTVTLIEDDSDSSSDTSDSSDDDTIHYPKSPSRPPPPQPLLRSKPIDIPHTRVSVTAVEVV